MFLLILTCWSVSHVHRFLKLKEINQRTRIPSIKVLQGSVIITTGIELEEDHISQAVRFIYFFIFLVPQLIVWLEHAYITRTLTILLSLH
jgi:hypothetical protein